MSRKDTSMQSVFKDYVFKNVMPDSLYKEQMQTFSDPTLCDYTPLVWSCVLKEDCKHEGFQKEFIDSFLQAAKLIAEKVKEQNASAPGMYIFHSYSLALPILYLARHCIELSIKRAIERLGGNPKRKHDLEKLWDSFLSYVPSERTNADDSILIEMRLFIQLVNKLDNSGTKLRYSEDDAGYTQNNFYWVNGQNIVSCTSNFVRQLELLIVKDERKEGVNDECSKTEI